MKLIFLLLISLVLLFGCESSRDSKTATNSNNSSASGASNSSEANKEIASDKKSASSEFKTLPFRAGEVPKDFSYEGKITDGAKWIDANGENTLIISEKTEQGAEVSVQKIFGYLYTAKNGETKLLWKIQDFAENNCDAGKGLTSPVEVRDIDDDGVAENMFVYNVAGACDVSPIPYKLMMHSGEKKLAVRGENAVYAPGVNDKGKKNFDEAFNSSPASYRSAASEFWDKHVKPMRFE